MTPEPVAKADIEQPDRRRVSVSTTLDYLVDSIGDYYAGLAQVDGPVLTIMDVASQPWLGLGAAAPVPDAGSPTPAGTATGFFVKGGQQAVGALVTGSSITVEDKLIPEWNYGLIPGGFKPDSFSDGFRKGRYTRTPRP